LHLEKGKEFKIIARNHSDKNIFIHSATLNGKPFDQAWIDHKDISQGGELIFEMNSNPSNWGNKIMPPTIK